MNIINTINSKVEEMINWLLVLTRKILSLDNFNIFDSNVGTLGLIMAPVSAALFLIAGIVGGIKTDSFYIFAGSILALITFFIAHWVGREMMPNCDSAVMNTRLRIRSHTIFKVKAFVSIAIFIGLLIFGSYISIKLSSLIPMLMPVGFAVLFLFAVWFFLNPTILNITEDNELSAGNDALTLYSLPFVMILRLHRIVFGVGLFYGNLAFGISIYKVINDGANALLGSGIQGFAGVIIIFSAAIAPFLMYVIFVFSYLFIDIMRSILRISK